MLLAGKYRRIMKFILLSSLVVGFVGLRVSGFDEVVGSETEAGAGSEAGWISAVSDSFVQPTDTNLESTVLSPLLMVIATAVTTTAMESGSASESEYSDNHDIEYVSF